MNVNLSLNESIVEDAALEWFGELSFAAGQGPHLAPGGPAPEQDRLLSLDLKECFQLNPK